MRQYKVKKIQHAVYDEIAEVPPQIIINKNWRTSNINEWVLADDGGVLQVLRKGTMQKAKGKVREINYIGTCTGTYPCTISAVLDTSRRKNIYSFSGEYSQTLIEQRRKLTNNEELFVQYLASGVPMREAYLMAFPTNDERYALSQAKTITKTERIKTAMKKELEPIVTELGITPEYVLGVIKDIAELSERDETRLKAVMKLSDILDLEDKNSTRVTQLTGAVFQGFSDEQLGKASKHIEGNKFINSVKED